MVALQAETMEEGFLKWEEIPVESFLQIIEMKDSTFLCVLEIKQNPPKVLSGKCESDKLWSWLKPSKTPHKIHQSGMATIFPKLLFIVGFF